MTINGLGTKLNYMESEVNEWKNKLGRNNVDKEVLLQQLKSQREQNLTLHQRLGELFNSHNINNIDDTFITSFDDRREEVIEETSRTALERSVFNWNISKSLRDYQMSGFNATEQVPKFDAVYVTDKVNK